MTSKNRYQTICSHFMDNLFPQTTPIMTKSATNQHNLETVGDIKIKFILIFQDL